MKGKAIGERGSWFARVDGVRLPCVHQHWVSGTTHIDPNFDASEPKFVELADQIARLGRVILTKDTVVSNPRKKSGIGFVRTGYIAVFDVAEVSTGADGSRFNLLNRVCELK